MVHDWRLWDFNEKVTPVETFNKFRNSLSLLIQETPNGIRYLKELKCKTLTLSVDYLLPHWSTRLDKEIKEPNLNNFDMPGFDS